MKATNPFLVLFVLAVLLGVGIYWSTRSQADVGPGEAPAVADQVPEIEAEPEPTPEELAIEMVKERLKDPYSAQFRNVRLQPEAGRVCGQVNARNAMGGYVGYRWFSVRKVPSGNTVVFIDSDGFELAAVSCENAGAR